MKLIFSLLACVTCIMGGSSCSRDVASPPANVPPGTTHEATPTSIDTNYVTRLYVDSQGLKMTYYLYVPENYTAQHSYPLLLFLHGVGERWNPDNTSTQNNALLLEKDYIKDFSMHSTDSTPQKQTLQDRRPCFILVPQIMDSQRWVNAPPASGFYRQATQPTDDLRMAKAIVDQVQKEYPGIDPERLYITGLSMGGQGTWDAITRWPQYFAAAIPIAGASDPTKAANLVNTPLWTFHGSQDSIVSVNGTRSMVAAITAAGGHPRYTEILGAEHGIWGKIYTSGGYPDLYPWLFAQHKTM
jgi:predicted peptidase